MSGALADLAIFEGKRLVVVGGYGTGSSGSSSMQWRSMWEAFVQYGESSKPAKEEIERARGCNYYCGDCHALTLVGSSVSSPADPSTAPEWERYDFGAEVASLLQRTGHTMSAVGSQLVLFGGKNQQRGSLMNDVWLLEFHPHRPPSLKQVLPATFPDVSNAFSPLPLSVPGLHPVSTRPLSPSTGFHARYTSVPTRPSHSDLAGRSALRAGGRRWKRE